MADRPPPPVPHHPEIDLRGVKTIPLGQRASKVTAADIIHLTPLGPEIRAFLDGLPHILAVEQMRSLARYIARAKRDGRAIVWALGAHVVKTGLSPLIIDLMERGLATAIAMNGAGAIHDYELAAAGMTSEEVAVTIQDGSFGMVRETAEMYARAAHRSREERIGLGAAIGLEIAREGGPHGDLSILAAGVRLGVPVTIHVAIGTDIVHMVPGLSGADLGDATYRDFKILAAHARDLSGGVWLNCGSAVVLPEVFLKIVSICRNLGHDLADITSADLDQVRNYRPMENVVRRPVARGFSLTGHHEILLPLLRLAIFRALEEELPSGGKGARP